MYDAFVPRTGLRTERNVCTRSLCEQAGVGEQLRKEKEGRSFGFFICSWNAFVGHERGEMRRNHVGIGVRDEHNGVIVTKNDEAFAVLLIDNYLEKWKMILGGEEQSADAETVNNTNMMREAEDNGRQGKKTTAKLPGKYTEKKSGHYKYGGWSRAGMARFNQLYSLVNNDSASYQIKVTVLLLLHMCVNADVTVRRFVSDAFRTFDADA
jgi:hypothetical protein